MAHGGQGPWAGFGRKAGGDQGVVDRRRKLAGELSVGGSASLVVDHKLQHDASGWRQAEVDAMAPVDAFASFMPSTPRFKRAIEATGGAFGALAFGAPGLIFGPGGGLIAGFVGAESGAYYGDNYNNPDSYMSTYYNDTGPGSQSSLHGVENP